MSSCVAEVVRIGEVTKHPNADTLYMTAVKGWNCITKDGQFTKGDLALYVPIDAVLPDALVEQYQLEYLKNGARVRSVKLRGVLSQGLLLTLPPGDWSEGQNATEAFGIKKWEPPAPAYQNAGTQHRVVVRNRPNPNFSRYCDPENIKHYPDLFQLGEGVVITEKIHGTNFRAGWVPRHWGAGWWAKLKRRLLGWLLTDWEFAVGSRNVHLVGNNPQFYEGNVYHQIAKRYGLKDRLPKGYTIYGEIYGDKIQDLTYGKKDGEIAAVFFDAKKGENYLDWGDFMTLCREQNLPIVPILHFGSYDPSALPFFTSGVTLMPDASKQMREGCVIKTMREVNDLHIGRKILKSVSPEYLLRQGGTEYH